jgi:hypothetical protein
MSVVLSVLPGIKDDPGNTSQIFTDPSIRCTHSEDVVLISALSISHFGDTCKRPAAD